MDSENKLIKKELSALMKELPSLEAVYEFLDDFVEKETAKLPEGMYSWESRKIFVAERMKSDLLFAITNEPLAKSKIDDSPEAYNEFLDSVRHMCKLKFRKD
jgi:hypothetical protein